MILYGFEGIYIRIRIKIIIIIILIIIITTTTIIIIIIIIKKKTFSRGDNI